MSLSTRLNLVEDKHVRRLFHQRETVAFSDPWLWATGKEELDLRDLGYEPPKDGQDRRSGFLVFAFVQGIDDNNGRNCRFHERLDEYRDS